MKPNTIDQREIAQFARDSSQWWDPNGPFRPLHWMTPARMEFIRDCIVAHFDLDDDSAIPLRGLSTVDIGCGGGLACEPMARLGAKVTGVDADATAIAVAQDHADAQNLKVDYVNGAAEDLVAAGRKFDIVLALEVIEHVSDTAAFMELCASLLSPGGILIISTLNRTWKSYALGIVAAEYILQWAARGTHDWKKFIKPSELARLARANNLDVAGLSGMVYNPLTHEFVLHPSDVDVNYFLVATAKPRK